VSLREAVSGPEDAEKLAQYYDLRHGAYQEDVDFYRTLARDQHLVLELGCGTGRLLAPLADEATVVLGVDWSSAMLARAAARVEAAGARDRVDLIRADLRFSVCQGASLAIMALNTFSYFTQREDQLRVLEAVHTDLATGGRLVLDLPNPYLEMDAHPAGVMVLQQICETAEGTLIEWSVAEVERAAQRLHLLSLYDLCGATGVRRDWFATELYLCYRPELELLLEMAGFRVEGVYGDFDYAQYGDDSPRMLVLAQPR